jgi:hypothetical protein
MRKSHSAPRREPSRAPRRIGDVPAVRATDGIDDSRRAAAVVDRAAARWRTALLGAVVALVLAMSAGAQARAQLVAAAVVLLCVSVLMRLRLIAARRVRGELRGPSLYRPSQEE